MRIAVDAMGSDRAPIPEVAGAVKATAADKAGALEVLLVGDQDRLQRALEIHPKHRRITVVHASEAITMEDQPALAVRRKKDSSLLVAMRLVRDGQADAVVSAGNTGAVMMAARGVLGPIAGVSRSGICQILPTITKKPTVLIDVGANVDCSARQLCEFAEMGMVYARRVLNVREPRVGLLNIGEEQIKGTGVIKTVHQTLTAAKHINFIGNVEPRAVFSGEADVVVCDGFVGNMVLKTSEAVGDLLRMLAVKELKSGWLSKLGALLSYGAFRRLKQTVDPNEYPGAPLLGVNGTVLILHGGSTSQGLANAMRGAGRAVLSELNDHIRAGIEELRRTEAQVSAATS